MPTPAMMKKMMPKATHFHLGASVIADVSAVTGFLVAGDGLLWGIGLAFWNGVAIVLDMA